MRLQPHTAPVPDDFFAALRRRRPDVDIVLLPPDLPPDGPTADREPESDEAVAATLDRVTAAADTLWTTITEEPRATPMSRVTFGSGTGTVVATSRALARTSDGFHALVRLRAELEDAGWRVRRLAGAVERLAARRDDLGLQASYAETGGVLLLQLTSDPMAVGQDRARALAGRH